MAWLTALRLLVVAAEVALLLPLIYLSAVCVSALMEAGRRRRRVRHDASAGQNQRAHPDFAVLIPAHNEEVVIKTLLDSLSGLAYPRDRFAVHVIADNCTDATAAIARAVGWVQVHERNDPDRRGKGYALQWAFRTLREQGRDYDAFVVLDADSVVVPEFLSAFAREVGRGAHAAQAHNTVLNMTESPSTVLRWLALTLMNHVRPLGRNGLGASSTLTGNGMCLTRQILDRYPWRAFGLTEDYQYYLTLAQDGVRVRYVPDAIVRSHMPPQFKQMRTQDVRWEAADPGQKNTRVAWNLLRAGIRHRDIVRLEAVAELLTPPLSLLVAGCATALVASLLVWYGPALALSGLLWLGVVWYLATALIMLRPPRSAYRALLFAPGFVIWKLWVYLVLRRRSGQTREWVRTSRSAS